MPFQHPKRFRQIISRIIAAYDRPVIRWYCWIRFWILRQRFLDEIGQYLPHSGRILDVGCGFGLFSQYYATLRPNLEIVGIDLDERRIAVADTAADRLALRNVSYRVGNAAQLEPQGQLDGAYMLDIVHHIPPGAVQALIQTLYASLLPGARLIVKDVERTPAYKRWFTYVLDKFVDYRAPVTYWDRADLISVFEAVGFEVTSHAMVDYLPYPHVVYICRKSAQSDRSVAA